MYAGQSSVQAWHRQIILLVVAMSILFVIPIFLDSARHGALTIYGSTTDSNLPSQIDYRLNERTSSCTPIRYGQSLNGSIDSPEQEDCYTFTGSASHRVTVYLWKGLCCNDFSLKLTRPDGYAWFCDFHFADCEIDNVKLPEDGVYTITVDGKEDEGGAYRLILNRLDGDLGGILYDESVQERISPAGDQDSFVFAGETNRRVTVDLHAGPCCARFSLTVLKPDGSAWFCGFSADGCTVENVTLPQTGNYIITVDAQGRGEYSYTLSLTCLSSCPPEPIGTRTATPTATVILLPPDATRTPTPTATVPLHPTNWIYIPMIQR